MTEKATEKARERETRVNKTMMRRTRVNSARERKEEGRKIKALMKRTMR